MRVQISVPATAYPTSPASIDSIGKPVTGPPGAVVVALVVVVADVVVVVVVGMHAISGP